MIINRDFAFYTTTLKDALEIDPDLFEHMTLDTTEHTNKFIDMFTARWDIYEIGGETVALFKRFIEDKFNTLKDVYIERLKTYEQEFNYLDGYVQKIKETTKTTNDNSLVSETEGELSDSKDSEYYDLPNRQINSGNGYLSKKDKIGKSSTGTSTTTNTEDKTEDIIRNYEKTGGVDILNQRIQYLNKYIRNIYLDFAEEFKSCFCLIYG